MASGSDNIPNRSIHNPHLQMYNTSTILTNHPQQVSAMPIQHQNMPIQISNISVPGSNSQHVGSTLMVRSINVGASPRFHITKPGQTQQAQLIHTSQPVSTFAAITGGTTRLSSTPLQIQQPVRVIQPTMFQTRTPIALSQQNLVQAGDNRVVQQRFIDQLQPIQRVDNTSYTQQAGVQLSNIPSSYSIEACGSVLMSTTGATPSRTFPLANLAGQQVLRVVAPTDQALQQQQQQRFQLDQHHSLGHPPQRFPVQSPQQMQAFHSHQIQQQQHQQHVHQQAMKQTLQHNLQPADQTFTPPQNQAVSEPPQPLAAALPTVGRCSAPPEPRSPEMNARMVSGLRNMASRFLPSIVRAIEFIKSSPENASGLKKYIRVKEILENPEANANTIRPHQLPKFEQFLQEIARNPEHILQQSSQHRAAAAAAAAIATAAAAASTDSTPGPVSRASTPVTHSQLSAEQQRLQAMALQQRQSQGASTPVAAFRENGTPTNLNALLSQPLESAGGGSLSAASFITGTGVGGGRSDTSSVPARQTLGGEDQAGNSRALRSAELYSELEETIKRIEHTVERETRDPDYALRYKRAVTEVSEEIKALCRKPATLLPRQLTLAPKGPLTTTTTTTKAVHEGITADALPDTSEVTELGTRKRTIADAGLDQTDCEFVKTEDGEAVKAKVEAETDTLMADKTGSSSSEIVFPWEHQLFEKINTAISDAPNLVRCFPDDQVERLKPSLIEEIKKISAKLKINIESNTTPPNVEEMESFNSCTNFTEWNRSCHLKFTYTVKGLPCSIPPLAVRLAPDYLSYPYVTWFLSEQDFEPINHEDEAGASSDNYTNEERSTFLKYLYSDIDLRLKRLRSAFCDKVTLHELAKSWILSLRVACTKFMRLNIFD